MSKCNHGGDIDSTDFCEECGSEYPVKRWISWFKIYRDDKGNLSHKECLNCGLVEKYHEGAIFNDLFGRTMNEVLYGKVEDCVFNGVVTQIGPKE